MRFPNFLAAIVIIGVTSLCLGNVLAQPAPPTPPMASVAAAPSSPTLRTVKLRIVPYTNDVSHRILYGTNSVIYPLTQEFGTNTVGSITNLIDGVRYYFVARAWNDFGESAPSNEVTWLASGTAVIVLLRSVSVSGPWTAIATNRVAMTNGQAYYVQRISAQQ